jgi:hypothetical protein
VDLFITARARIHSTTVRRAGPVPLRKALGVWKDPNCEAHQLCARDIEANAGWYNYSATQHNPVADAKAHRDIDARINTNTNTNTKADANANSDSNTGSNANTHSGAADV